MKNWTKQEFFQKMSWEGDFESMAYYTGQACITDDIDMENAWNRFVLALEELDAIYDDWQENNSEDDPDDLWSRD